MAPWEGAAIRQPALFIAGKKDPVISFPGAKELLSLTSEVFPGARLQTAGTYELAERCPLLVMDHAP